MRTDTRTFAKRVFAQVRALGINSVRSKHVARRIVSGISHGAYMVGGEQFAARGEIGTLELELAIRGSFQSVMVTVDGEFAFSESTPDRRLVSLDTTPEQRDLAQPIFEAMIDLFGGEDHERPALQAAYDALRDRSLALNPFAHANEVDPALFGCYSDTVKEEDGRRPSGHVTVAECRSWLLRHQEPEREAA